MTAGKNLIYTVVREAQSEDGRCSAPIVVGMYTSAVDAVSAVHSVDRSWTVVKILVTGWED